MASTGPFAARLLVLRTAKLSLLQNTVLCSDAPPQRRACALQRWSSAILVIESGIVSRSKPCNAGHKVYRKNKISLQDPTTFFHLRLRGFCSRFVRHHRDYKMKDFKTYFKFDNLVIKRFDQLSGNATSENLFVCVLLQYTMMLERCFYPHVLMLNFCLVIILSMT